jgi:hypothetical protein
MMTIAAGKQVALAWGVPRPPRIAVGDWRGHLQTTSRGFLRRLAQTMPTPLGTDSRSFMASASHTLAAEPGEGPDGSDVAPFPKENAVMTVLGGCPLEGRCRMPSLSPRISTCGGWATGAQGCNSASSPPHSNKNINIYISICFLQSSPKATEKRGTGSVPWAGAGVQRFLQAFQDEGDNP